MLERENLLRALKRENQSPRPIQFAGSSARRVDYLFLCQFSQDSAALKQEEALVDRMSEALKLSKNAWAVVSAPEMSLQMLSQMTKDYDCRCLVLLSEKSSDFSLAGARLIQGPSPAQLLKNQEQKRILWEKLKVTQQ